MKYTLRALPAFLTTLCFATAAWGDVPPPNDCTTPGQACNNAPPDYKSPGICTATECPKAFPPPDGSIVPCNLCLADDGGTGSGGSAGSGGSGTAGSAGTATGGTSSGGSSDDGGCSVSRTPSGGTTPALVLAALAGIALGRRRR